MLEVSQIKNRLAPSREAAVSNRRKFVLPDYTQHTAFSSWDWSLDFTVSSEEFDNELLLSKKEVFFSFYKNWVLTYKLFTLCKNRLESYLVIFSAFYKKQIVLFCAGLTA